MAKVKRGECVVEMTRVAARRRGAEDEGAEEPADERDEEQHAEPEEIRTEDSTLPAPDPEAASAAPRDQFDLL